MSMKVIDTIFMKGNGRKIVQTCLCVRVCAFLKVKEQRELHLQLLSTSGKLLSAQL